MYKILASLVALIFFIKPVLAEKIDNKEVFYQFYNGNNNCIRIAVNFKGDESGESIIITPWESYAHLKHSNFNFQVEEGEVSLLLAQPPVMKIKHNKNAAIRIEYEVCNSLDGTPRIPVIQDTWFHLFGKNILAFPNIPLNDKIKASFDFTGISNNLNIYSDYGEGKHFSCEVPMERFIFAQFIGTQQSPKEINTENNTIIIENAKWLSFEEKELTKIANNLIRFQREKMKDHDFSRYYIFFLQQPENKSFKVVSGIHSDHFISLVFPDGPKEKRYKTIYSLSHELFHSWLWGKLLIPVNLQLKYNWFYEGFTDYFGLKLACDSGYVTQAEYIKVLNEYSSQYFDVSKNVISIQSQIKGHFLALHFEHLIKEKKLPNDLMFQFIRTLIDSSGGFLKEELFWIIFHRYFDKDFYDVFLQYVEKDGMTGLPPLLGHSVVSIDKQTPDGVRKLYQYL